MKCRRRRYAHSIMSLTRAELDRSRVARILWETCRIPAILYCSEVMSYSKRTTEALEKIQVELETSYCRFPGQPRKYPHGQSECLKEAMENPEEDEWARDIKEIEEAIEANIPDLNLKQLREKVNDVAIGDVLDANREQ